MRPLLLITCLIGLLLSLSLTLPMAAQDTNVLETGLAMTMSPIAVFVEADRKSDKLAQLELGTLVNVLQIDGDWAQIEHEGVVGWTQHAMPSRDLYFLINVNGPTPLARGYHQMAYDAESDRMILFNGLTSLTSEFVNDTWAYDVGANTWTQMAPAQSPPAGEGPLAYDSQSDRIIWLYGTNATLSNTASETWAYDFNSDTWTNLLPTSAPPPLLGARMVYDVESDRMIWFGGINQDLNTYHNDTWAYDYDSNTWTKMEPAVSPPGMNYFPMAYDADADRVMLVDTYATETMDNIWLYDYNTNRWESRKTAEKPGLRDYSSMVYVDGTRRMILFGEGEPTSKNDTWSYDCDANAWTMLTPAEAPSERGWHALAYSSAADRVVLFGGGADRGHFTLETWVFDPNANTWTQVGP